MILNQILAGQGTCNLRMTDLSEHHKPRLPGGFSLPPFGLHQMLAIVVVCVALWSLGVLWLGMQVAGQWMGSWQSDIRFHVYLAPENNGAPESSGKMAELADQIGSLSGVAEVRVVEQAEAVAWLHSWLGETGLADEEMARRLPASLEVIPADEAGEFLFDDIRDEAGRFGAIVNDDESYLLQAQALLADMRLIGWFSTLLLALAMAIIISNTLRMLLLARADEVCLMRLLGAREWFVRLPFVLEGMLLGAVSGLLAWLLCWPLIFGAAQWLAGTGISLSGFPLLPPLLFGGAVVGCIGALIATTRLDTEGVKAGDL